MAPIRSIWSPDDAHLSPPGRAEPASLHLAASDFSFGLGTISEHEGMSTSPVSSSSSSAASAAAAAASAASSDPDLSLSSSDFMNMMITQLQNQDPLNPTSTDDLMSEMSQIGQMQSNSQLQTTLTGLASQTQIGAASSLIGKQVTGIDANNNDVAGNVSSVQVTSSGVNLQLDSGGTLSLSNVATIGPGTTAAASGS